MAFDRRSARIRGGGVRVICRRLSERVMGIRFLRLSWRIGVQGLYDNLNALR